MRRSQASKDRSDPSAGCYSGSPCSTRAAAPPVSTESRRRRRPWALQYQPSFAALAERDSTHDDDEVDGIALLEANNRTAAMAGVRRGAAGSLARGPLHSASSFAIRSGRPLSVLETSTVMSEDEDDLADGLESLLEPELRRRPAGSSVATGGRSMRGECHASRPLADTSRHPL
jgi:hypothetical protein